MSARILAPRFATPGKVEAVHRVVEAARAAFLLGGNYNEILERAREANGGVLPDRYIVQTVNSAISLERRS